MTPSRIFFVSLLTLISLIDHVVAETSRNVDSVHSPSDYVNELRIGIIDTFDPYFYLETFVPTIEYLSEQLPQYNLKIEEISHLKLTEDLEKKKPDFLLSSSGIYSDLLNSHGVQQIVTRRRTDSPNVSASVGSAIIVRNDRKDLKDIRDLKNKIVAAYHPDNFEAWTTAQNEIAKAGFDPEKFYKKIVFTHYLSPDISTLVAGGVVDAGILPSCRLEKLLELGLARKGEFRVLNPKNDGGCLHTTELFPDAVFSHFPSAGSQAVRDVAVALMGGQIKENKAFEWLPAANFLAVYDLQRNLKIGNFAHLRVQTLQGFIEKNMHWLIFAGVLILFALVHIVRVNMLVKKTTRNLLLAVHEKEMIERKIRENKEKLEKLEKGRALGHITAIFAHEVKQPVTALIYYASILSEVFQLQKSKDPVVQESVEQMSNLAKRISEIVEHVRSHVKTGTGVKVKCDLEQVLSSAVKSLKAGGEFREENFIQLEVQKGSYVLAEPLEIELAFLNLLKNSAAAVIGRSSPQIQVKVKLKEDHWIVTIADNGKNISPEMLKQFGKAMPGKSSTGGLGIGLSMVVEIIQSLGGNVSFHRREPYGLVVEVKIPKFDDLGR